MHQGSFPKVWQLEKRWYGLNGLQFYWFQAGQPRYWGMRISPISEADSTACRCSEGSGPWWSLERKQTLITGWTCKQLFRQAASVEQMLHGTDLTLKMYLLLLCSSYLTGHLLFYLAILITAEHWCESRVLLHFLGHQIITQLGRPKGTCSPRYEARGSPRRPVPILPTWLLCLPSSERQISFILKPTFSASLIHTD